MGFLKLLKSWMRNDMQFIQDPVYQVDTKLFAEF